MHVRWPTGPELATGCIESVIVDLVSASWLELVHTWQSRLSDEDWNTLSTDFQIGKIIPSDVCDREVGFLDTLAVEAMCISPSR